MLRMPIAIYNSMTEFRDDADTPIRLTFVNKVNVSSLVPQKESIRKFLENWQTGEDETQKKLKNGPIDTQKTKKHVQNLKEAEFQFHCELQLYLLTKQITLTWKYFGCSSQWACEKIKKKYEYYESKIFGHTGGAYTEWQTQLDTNPGRTGEVLTISQETAKGRWDAMRVDGHKKADYPYKRCRDSKPVRGGFATVYRAVKSESQEENECFAIKKSTQARRGTK
ncbi:MAG: hypothetical protein M1814_000516 [Vezdaea aestivalis]|nr:MAG: hypothetical protein M1814_000516 [Vezdaea aestivalis]